MRPRDATPTAATMRRMPLPGADVCAPAAGPPDLGADEAARGFFAPLRASVSFHAVVLRDIA